MCERQSGRLGVISTSKMVSPGGRTWLIGVPSAGRPSRIKRPLWSSPIPSSLPEQSIPSESWPRILDCFILKSPGRRAPGSATGTLSPTL